MKLFLPLLLSAALGLLACAVPSQNNASKQTVYIVHGYAASPNDHWFVWLKNSVESSNVAVKILQLPNPESPNIEAWLAALEAQTESIDENTFFVAHSLGSISLLRFIEASFQGSRIGGYILVSGFNQYLPHLPQLNEFIEPNVDYKRLVQVSRHRVVISARDDAIVPFEFSTALSEKLEAKWVPIETGGHFLASDGFSSFPLVLQELQWQLGMHNPN